MYNFENDKKDEICHPHLALKVSLVLQKYRENTIAYCRLIAKGGFGVPETPGSERSTDVILLPSFSSLTQSHSSPRKKWQFSVCFVALEL